MIGCFYNVWDYTRTCIPVLYSMVHKIFIAILKCYCPQNQVCKHSTWWSTEVGRRRRIRPTSIENTKTHLYNTQWHRYQYINKEYTKLTSESFLPVFFGRKIREFASRAQKDEGKKTPGGKKRKERKKKVLIAPSTEGGGGERTKKVCPFPFCLIFSDDQTRNVIKYYT